MAAHFSYTWTVQLEYTNYLLQFSKLFSYYASIMLIMLSVTYNAQNYASIIGWSLLETQLAMHCGENSLIDFH